MGIGPLEVSGLPWSVEALGLLDHGGDGLRGGGPTAASRGCTMRPAG